MNRLLLSAAGCLVLAALAGCGPASAQGTPLSGHLLDYNLSVVAEITDARAETDGVRTVQLLSMGTPTMARTITYSVDCSGQAYRQTSARDYFDGLPPSEDRQVDTVEFVQGPHWPMLAEVCQSWDHALGSPDFTTVEQFKTLAAARNPHRSGPAPIVVPHSH